jgi:xanthine dehydrogenase accessory factor
MRDLLKEYEQLHGAGRPVGRAVVTSVWGSAPRAEGACMLATADGTLAGSVSGGCVEGAAAREIATAIASGVPKLVTYGVTDEKAWEVGLACGGTIKVFVEPAVSARVLEAARSDGGVVVATVIEVDSGELPGTSVLLGDDGQVEANRGDGWLATAVADAARIALRREASTTVQVPAPGAATATVFLEVYPRLPRLVIFGGVHIAMALVPLAKALGYRTVVADGRQSFLTRERFPDADQLLLGWPAEAFQKAALDAATFVCVLSHDPKFDEPAVDIALRSEARYVGAIGSKKTQASRRERLRAQGFSEADLARLHGPIGLNLGGRAPAEIALAILAEMTMARYGATGRSLTPA